LTAAINLVGRTKESKWRAASQPAIGSQESGGSALLRVLTDRLEMPPAWKKLTNFRVLIMTGRPKRLKTERESGFKAHPPSLREPALDPQAHGFAAVASDPSHKSFGYDALIASPCVGPIHTFPLALCRTQVVLRALIRQMSNVGGSCRNVATYTREIGGAERMAHATYHLAAGRPANVCYASNRYRGGKPLKPTRSANSGSRPYSITSSAQAKARAAFAINYDGNPDQDGRPAGPALQVLRMQSW
jgi:hypothetical protein